MNAMRFILPAMSTGSRIIADFSGRRGRRPLQVLRESVGDGVLDIPLYLLTSILLMVRCA
jgi:hypothetical protein